MRREEVTGELVRMLCLKYVTQSGDTKSDRCLGRVCGGRDGRVDIAVGYSLWQLMYTSR